MSEVSLTGFRDNLREMVRTGELGRALMRATDEAGNQMIILANTDYLRGPRPERLGVVSGALSRSLRKPIEPSNTGITLTLTAGGGPENVTYARRHELGEGIRARPYLRPSRDQVLREQVPKIFTTEIRETMQRLFTGG